jgi:hypothetical protein
MRCKTKMTAGSKASPRAISASFKLIAYPFPVALCAWTLLTTGCVHPLGPGYRFAGRQTEIRVSAGAPEQLHIRVVDHFDNVGNLPLRSQDVRLPEGPNHGARDVRVTVDGKEVSLERGSNTDRRLMRAAFDPAWKQQQAREIVTEWDLRQEPSTLGTAASSAAAFYVADETALPLWQPPSGFLTQGGPDPLNETLTVSAPSDFRILAPGKPLKRIVSGNSIKQTFQIKPGEDFLPYVVAGRYQEQVLRAPRGAVIFWTFQPLDARQATIAAARLSTSVQALTDFFGPGSGARANIHIAEAPGELPDDFGEEEGSAGGTSFPEGVLLDSRAFAQGIANESVLELAEYELARTWFGWRLRPRPEARILMGRGAALYSLVIAAGARGQDQRGRMIGSLMERYDHALHNASDRPLLEPPAGYSREEQISTGYKAALFFVALEDLCGRDNLRATFKRIVRARSGADVGYEDLRAAVESASGRDLAEMFHTWLTRPGLPEDFRARYGNPRSAYRIGF